MCDETEEGRVDPMKNVFVSELYVSTLAVCNVIEKEILITFAHTTPSYNIVFVRMWF